MCVGNCAVVRRWLALKCAVFERSGILSFVCIDVAHAWMGIILKQPDLVAGYIVFWFMPTVLYLGWHGNAYYFKIFRMAWKCILFRMAWKCMSIDNLGQTSICMIDAMHVIWANMYCLILHCFDFDTVMHAVLGWGRGYFFCWLPEWWHV